jgi:hypothetical protein
MALPAHFEDGIRERAPDIDGERHPARIAWLHGPRLYRAIGGPSAILTRGGALFFAGLSMSNGPFDNEGRVGLAHMKSMVKRRSTSRSET